MTSLKTITMNLFVLAHILMKQAGAVGLWIDLQGCSVCRHDVPAACSGTLIAPDLVLSARHCLDIPRELNGTLDRVVFSNNLLDPKAPSSKVLDVRVPADYGSQSQGFVRGTEGFKIANFHQSLSFLL